MSNLDRGVYPGTAELLILRVISEEPMHGFAISRTLRRQSDGVVELQDAALYQALHRMRREGLVESEWGVSELNRRARFYRLTERGRARLALEARSWREYVAAVARILGPGPAEGG